MQISLSKLLGVITIIVTVGMVGYAGYFLFTIFFQGPKVDPTPVVTMSNIDTFSPKLQKAVNALVNPSQKISLNSQKNLGFLNTDLYKSFSELPVIVATTTVRGREDPFVPYVAP